MSSFFLLFVFVFVVFFLERERKVSVLTVSACFFLASCSADLTSSSVTPCVERLVSRTRFAWAFRCVSDSSSRTGGTNDLKMHWKTNVNQSCVKFKINKSVQFILIFCLKNMRQGKNWEELKGVSTAIIQLSCRNRSGKRIRKGIETRNVKREVQIKLRSNE